MLSLQQVASSERQRILLLAPSNAAVDELMKKLVKDQQQKGKEIEIS